MSSGKRIRNLCGLVHFGPICINGSQLQRPCCMACGENVTPEQRAQVSRMHVQVQAMLAKHRKKEDR